MPIKEFGKILNWKLLLLSLFSATALQFYVAVKQKVPFQIEVPIEGIPKGYTVFPEKAIIFGKLSEKLYRQEVLNCFKATVKWEKGKTYLHVEVKVSIPSPFVEIEGVHPQAVQVRPTPF